MVDTGITCTIASPKTPSPLPQKAINAGANTFNADDSITLEFDTPETLKAKEIARIKSRDSMPLWYITSSGHDCDHPPLQVHGSDRMDAWWEAARQAESLGNQDDIDFLSVPPNYITVWTEKEWLDAEQRIEPGFSDACKYFKDHPRANTSDGVIPKEKQ